MNQSGNQYLKPKYKKSLQKTTLKQSFEKFGSPLGSLADVMRTEAELNTT
jgi:hypothetical protein